MNRYDAFIVVTSLSDIVRQSGAGVEIDRPSIFAEAVVGRLATCLRL